MALRGCSDSHFIWSIKAGVVRKVNNVDADGRPSLKFKKLEDIYLSADAATRKFQDGYDGSSAGNEGTPLPYVDRETNARNGRVIQEDGPECPSSENSFEKLTLSQLKKRYKSKKRKTSEPVLLIPKVEDDDSDLSEPLFKFRVKASKSLQTKVKPANGSFSTSSNNSHIVASELSTGRHDALMSSKDPATVNVKVDASKEEFFECRETAQVYNLSNCNGPVRFIASESGFILDNHDAFTPSKDPATVNVKVDAPEEELFECGETTHAHNPSICNGPVRFIASESGFILDNDELKSRKLGSLTNEGEIHGLNKVSLDNLDNIKNTFPVFPIGGENMEVDNEENMDDIPQHLPASEVKEECVNQPPSVASSLEDDSPVEDLTASTSDCFESHPDLQQTPEQVNYKSGVQDSDSTIDDYFVNLCQGSPKNRDYGSPSLMTNPWLSPNDNDVVCVEAKSPIYVKPQNTSVSTDAASRSSNSDNNSFVLEGTFILQEQPSFVPEGASILQRKPCSVPEDVSNLQEQPSSVPKDTSTNQEQPSSILREKLSFVLSNVDSEVKFSNRNCQTDTTSEASEIRNSDFIEFRHSERLPQTRKAISPTSQEKLRLAMKSAESLDDMDDYKCKEKLCFGEQADNKCSSTSTDVEYNEPNVHPQQSPRLIRNKVFISGTKHILKKSKNFKRGSPPQTSLPSKGCLDGPRLCRSLPRLSTGCTSIQGCSENAIAFSQRQMHDIESLASKLLSELNSMKVIVEEKMLYEAYRSASLKNEADEVKSAIKSATKTEETARKWLSMMARDCSRFCKIMKLKEDNNESASADPAPVEDKPIEREKRKISFADEAGGTLCDIKVYEIEGTSLESNGNSEL